MAVILLNRSLKTLLEPERGTCTMPAVRLDNGHCVLRKWTYRSIIT